MVTFDGTEPFVDARILISGASGNLGRELALLLAKPGVRFSLWGRDTERLLDVAVECRARGAKADIRALDLIDLDAALTALRREDDAHRFNMAFLVAGQGDTLPPGTLVEDPDQIARLCHANFVAPAAMASVLAERMASRKKGRIGLVGTAAASHSLPFAATYAASKAGLSRYADALRLAVRSHGVSITLVSPGFFHAGRGGASDIPSRPGEVSARYVAERMIAAAMSGRAELVIPRRFLLLRWFDRLIPRPLRDRILLSLRLP